MLTNELPQYDPIKSEITHKLVDSTHIIFLKKICTIPQKRLKAKEVVNILSFMKKIAE
jgi:hypothetical protein